MNGAPPVSIVLVTRDGITTLPELLDAVAAQEAPFEFEVVAVDSGSSDGSAELLEARVDRLVRIQPEEFDHGLTRNLAVESCRGELVVLLVQDAVPASRCWLEELVAPFALDPALAGTFARQLPRPETGRLTRLALSRWVAAGGEARVVGPLSGDALAAMRPLERYTTCAFDNVCSCLRRDVWARIPFRAAPIAEDVAWGLEVLTAGYRVAFVPSSQVLHAHERPARHELERTRLAHRRLFELFGVRTVPTLPALLRAVPVTLAEHLRCLARGEGPRPRAGEVARAVALAFAWPLGQYLGGREEARRARRSASGGV